MNLDDMIAAERSAPAEATNTQTADVWRSIEHSCVSIAPPAGAALTATKTTTLAKLGGALSTATGKVLLVAALGTAGLIGANDLGTSHEDLSAAEPAVSRVETTPPTAALPTRPGPRVAEIAIEPEPEPKSASESASEPESSGLREQGSGPVLAPATAPPKQRPRPTPAASSAPKPSIQEELALIRRTQAALRMGDHARALSLARQHAKAYPDGAFVEDREALHVLASCKSGETTASGAASKFLERWPKSMHRSRIEAACE